MLRAGSRLAGCPYAESDQLTGDASDAGAVRAAAPPGSGRLHLRRAAADRPRDRASWALARCAVLGVRSVALGQPVALLAEGERLAVGAETQLRRAELRAWLRPSWGSAVGSSPRGGASRRRGRTASPRVPEEMGLGGRCLLSGCRRRCSQTSPCAGSRTEPSFGGRRSAASPAGARAAAAGRCSDRGSAAEAELSPCATACRACRQVVAAAASRVPAPAVPAGAGDAHLRPASAPCPGSRA